MNRLLLIAFAGLALAGCAQKQAAAPTDVGSMAQPTPTGGTNQPAGMPAADTGSMSVPAARNVVREPARTSVDTGSMSVPAAK